MERKIVRLNTYEEVDGRTALVGSELRRVWSTWKEGDPPPFEIAENQAIREIWAHEEITLWALSVRVDVCGDLPVIYRKIAQSAQGRAMFLTKEECQERCDAILQGNGRSTLLSVFGCNWDTLAPAPFKCWHHGDPKGIFLDALPGDFPDGKEWRSFDDQLDRLLNDTLRVDRAVQGSKILWEGQE